jgi:TonB family protein
MHLNAFFLLFLFGMHPQSIGGVGGAVADADCVVHIEAPTYNNVARFAGLQGEVVIKVEINPDGKVTSAHSLSGNSLLRQEADKNIRTWVFATGESRAMEVHYIFRLEEPKVENNPPTRVTFDLPHTVTLVSNFAPVEP